MRALKKQVLPPCEPLRVRDALFVLVGAFVVVGALTVLLGYVGQ